MPLCLCDVNAFDLVYHSHLSILSTHIGSKGVVNQNGFRQGDAFFKRFCYWLILVFVFAVILVFVFAGVMLMKGYVNNCISFFLSF